MSDRDWAGIRDWLRSERERAAPLRDAIEDALRVLGEGECAMCQCEGCKAEAHEVHRILTEALDIA